MPHELKSSQIARPSCCLLSSSVSKDAGLWDAVDKFLRPCQGREERDIVCMCAFLNNLLLF